MNRKQMEEKLTILAHLHTVLGLGNEIIGALNGYLDYGEDGDEIPEENYLTGDFRVQEMRIRPKYKEYFEILTSSKTMKEAIDKGLKLEEKKAKSLDEK